jgi:hypothetical protein
VDTFISTILYARGTLEFDNYVEVLKIHLDKLREVHPVFIPPSLLPSLPLLTVI